MGGVESSLEKLAVAAVSPLGTPVPGPASVFTRSNSQSALSSAQAAPQGPAGLTTTAPGIIAKAAGARVVLLDKVVLFDVNKVQASPRQPCGPPTRSTAPGPDRDRYAGDDRTGIALSQKSQQAEALLLITEHALVVARPSNGKVLNEMQLADVKRIESSTPEVRTAVVGAAAWGKRKNAAALMHAPCFVDGSAWAGIDAQEVQVYGNKTSYGFRASNVDDIISYIRVCHTRDFPTMPAVRSLMPRAPVVSQPGPRPGPTLTLPCPLVALARGPQSAALKVDVTPESRLNELARHFPSFNLQSPPIGPCGGFSRTYMSHCEAMGIPSRGDIIW